MSGKLDGCSYAWTLKNLQSTHIAYIGYRAHRAVIFAIAWHLVISGTGLISLLILFFFLWGRRPQKKKARSFHMGSRWNLAEMFSN